jgi:hypothetical protein
VIWAVGAFLLSLSSAFLFAQADPRVPAEVRYKSGYVSATRKPSEFSSAMLWGIAIADTRIPGYQNATIEIAHTKLGCRVDGHDFILNDDRGAVRGGLYQRFPWFSTDAHEALPLDYSHDRSVVILHPGSRADRAWHFWAASPRAGIPVGHFEGCSVKMRVRIAPGALLQIGLDYWRNSTIGYGQGGNNREAGASNWYFPSDAWQEAEFSDVKP